jgi:ubiquinone biosynthesis protein UbiJ
MGSGRMMAIMSQLKVDWRDVLSSETGIAASLSQRNANGRSNPEKQSSSSGKKQKLIFGAVLREDRRAVLIAKKLQTRSALTNR